MDKKKAEAIVKQLEYYFGVFNLQRDRYLLQLTQKNEGWVEITELIKFKRINDLTTSLTSLKRAISENQSQILEVSEDKTKIRRIESYPVPELDDKSIESIKQRAVVCRGFKSNATFYRLEKFFLRLGNVQAFKMEYRKMMISGLHQFVNVVKLVFNTLQDAYNFMSLKTFNHNNRIIRRMWLLDYEKERKLKNRTAMVSSSADKNKADYIVIENLAQRKFMSEPLDVKNFLTISNVTYNILAEELTEVIENNLDVKVLFVVKTRVEPRVYVYCLTSPKQKLQELEEEEIEGLFGKHRVITFVPENKGIELCQIFKNLIETWAKFPKRPAEEEDSDVPPRSRPCFGPNK